MMKYYNHFFCIYYYYYFISIIIYYILYYYSKLLVENRDGLGNAMSADIMQRNNRKLVVGMLI